TLSAIAAILAAAMAFMGSGSSYALMLAGRVTIGITEGPQFGTAISVVKRWFPSREQALGNAVWTIGSPLGSMIGFPLVIFLVAQLACRLSFYMLAALNAFIVLRFVWFFLRDRPADTVPMAVASQEKQMPFGHAFTIVMRDTNSG